MPHSTLFILLPHLVRRFLPFSEHFHGLHERLPKRVAKNNQTYPFRPRILKDCPERRNNGYPKKGDCPANSTLVYALVALGAQVRCCLGLQARVDTPKRGGIERDRQFIITQQAPEQLHFFASVDKS